MKHLARILTLALGSLFALLLSPLAPAAFAASIAVTAPTPGQVIAAGSNAPLAATVNLPADKGACPNFCVNGVSNHI